MMGSTDVIRILANSYHLQDRASQHYLTCNRSMKITGNKTPRTSVSGAYVPCQKKRSFLLCSSHVLRYRTHAQFAIGERAMPSKPTTATSSGISSPSLTRKQSTGSASPLPPSTLLQSPPLILTSHHQVNSLGGLTAIVISHPPLLHHPPRMVRDIRLSRLHVLRGQILALPTEIPLLEPNVTSSLMRQS